MDLKNLRRNFERFCFRNRDKGIPNLMLYICLGSGIVAFANLMNGGAFIYNTLCFDKTAILHGQVWRLVTWLFTEHLGGNPVLSVVFLYFFYRLGSAVESSIGTFKFNLFYLGGVILMDLFAMIFCPTETLIISNMMIPPEMFAGIYSNMAYYLHLSMVLAFSTTYPDSQFLIFFMIPVKAWVLALVDLVLIGISVFNMCYPIMFFPHCLFPLIGLLNYFLFFGPDMHNLLPLSWQARIRRMSGKNRTASNSAKKQPKVIPFPGAATQSTGTAKSKAPYTHRCTICGRTDISDADMEFRYCSRCKGYHCYCQEHINNHTHVE